MNQNQFTEISKNLAPKLNAVFCLFLRGKSDGEIARHIEASEATVRKHIQNLCDRFEINQENQQKGHRREILKFLAAQYRPDLLSRSLLLSLEESGTIAINTKEPITTHLKADWGNAPDVALGFYGREEELKTLKTWIVEDKCRLVGIVGIGGIGKRTLAAKLAENIKSNFKYVIWRAVKSSQSLKETLINLIQPIFTDQTQEISISDFIDYLNQYRCLVILDNLEKVLPGEEYDQFLQRIGQERHQSCLVVISREKTRTMAVLEAEDSPIHTLSIKGLREEDAKKVLIAKGFLGNEPKIEKLIAIYRGNPLALKMIASTIRETYSGDIEAFLRQGTIIIRDIQDTLYNQFFRLSDLEKEIMYWLAIIEEPLTIEQIQEKLLFPVEIQEALQSLIWKSLLEKEKKTQIVYFKLQPTIKEYVFNHFIEQIIQEINQQNFQLLKTHSLLPNTDKKNMNQHQEYRIILVIEKLLLAQLANPQKIKAKLAAILVSLHDLSPLELGYTFSNLLHLFQQLGTDLTNYELEGMGINQIKDLTKAQKLILDDLGIRSTVMST